MCPCPHLWSEDSITSQDSHKDSMGWLPRAAECLAQSEHSVNMLIIKVTHPAEGKEGGRLTWADLCLGESTNDGPKFSQLHVRCWILLLRHLLPVLVPLGFYNTIPHSGRLINTDTDIRQFWRLNVQDQATGRFRSGETPLSGSLTAEFCCVLAWQNGPGSSLGLLL